MSRKNCVHNLQPIGMQYDVHHIVGCSILPHQLFLLVVIFHDALIEQRLFVFVDFVERTFGDSQHLGHIVHLDRTDATSGKRPYGRLQNAAL